MNDNHMKGKIIFITGATSGIGKETAKGLAKLGANVVFTTRDIKKGEQVKDEIIRKTNNNHINILFCDLASFESIRTCYMKFFNQYNSLDILINNAGVLNFKRTLTKDGVESNFAINYLAPFLITNLFLPLLRKSTQSRIINVTSGLQSGSINFDDIEYKHNFSGWDAYRQSKLALILFTRYLANQLKETSITVNCVHPGMTNTNLVRNAGWLKRVYFKLKGNNPSRSAEALIYLASSLDLIGITGEYFFRKEIKKSSTESYDMNVAKQLWVLSKNYVGLSNNKK